MNIQKTVQEEEIIRAIAVGINTPDMSDNECERSLEELGRLIDTAGGELVATFIQNRDKFDAKTQFQKAIEDLNNEVFYKIESIWALYPNSEKKREEEIAEVLKYKERKMTKIYKELHPSNQGFWKKLLNKFC